MGDQVGKGGVLSGMLSQWRIRKVLPNLSGRVLDFGCGSGNLALFVEPHNYVGVDQDEETLLIAQKLHPKHIFIKEIPNNRAFDTIVALAAIEHITDPTEIICKFKSILTDNGKIVITTPHPISDKIHGIGSQIGLFSSAAHEEHNRLYNHWDMQQIAKESGLYISQYERFMIGFNQIIIIKSP